MIPFHYFVAVVEACGHKWMYAWYVFHLVLLGGKKKSAD